MMATNPFMKISIHLKVYHFGRNIKPTNTSNYPNLLSSNIKPSRPGFLYWSSQKQRKNKSSADHRSTYSEIIMFSREGPEFNKLPTSILEHGNSNLKTHVKSSWGSALQLMGWNKRKREPWTKIWFNFQTSYRLNKTAWVRIFPRIFQKQIFLKLSIIPHIFHSPSETPLT